METPSTLYLAATEALVSETSATSTFEKMIQVAYNHATEPTFAKEVKETEDKIKKEFDISSMPSPWRSAKSVIQTSMKLSLSLINDNGTFFGKTHLQNKIKEIKRGAKAEMTSLDYAQTVIAKLINVPEGMDHTTIILAVKEFLATK